MKLHYILLTLVAVLFGCSQKSEGPAPSKPAESAAAASSNMVPKLANALAQAKKENKYVFLDFTGSDWCGPCMQMDQFIFPKRRFTDFADAHLVMVKLDFPKKEKLPDEEQAMNDALQEQFKVESFPTLVLLDANGKTVWRAEEAPPSLGEFLAELENAVGK